MDKRLEYYTGYTSKGKIDIRYIPLLDYYSKPYGTSILLQNIKKIHPRLNDDTIEGLSVLSTHPALMEEERQFYKDKLYEKCQSQIQELSQLQASLQQLNITEPSSPM